MTKESRQKFKYLENEKNFSDKIKVYEKYIFRELSLKQIKQIFLEVESPTLRYSSTREATRIKFFITSCVSLVAIQTCTIIL